MWELLGLCVSCICQRITNEAETSLGDAARRLFTYLTGWAQGEIRSRIFSMKNAVKKIRFEPVPLVGVDEKLSEIRSHLSNKQVGIIGIYGMAGSGKTTLLVEINNHFYENGTGGMFDVVIWVTVSREAKIATIQKQIGDRLGLSFSDGTDQSLVEQQANDLNEALSKKQFLLLMDDVWTVLELWKIGIPELGGESNRKIAFTTRMLNVCRDMSANKKVEVDAMDLDRSWELFGKVVGEEAPLQNPQIDKLARMVVGKCGGLPLAITTIGRAMRGRWHPAEWRGALKALDDSAEELGGDDELLPRLKVSYDFLENDAMRSALLFCAMYPEDCDISREELIEYWVGEGLLSCESGRIDDARDKGHMLIGKLQDACMLQHGITDPSRKVRMHDAIRDMALWQTRHGKGDVGGFCRLDEEKLTYGDEIEGGERVRRIWMRHLQLKGAPGCIEACPNTWTLLLNRTSFGQSLLVDFFQSMKALRVLDLSVTTVEVLPVEIGSLEELQYLNLSFTRIGWLPKEVGRLKKLRQLVLESTYYLNRVPRGAITGLESTLQVLNMWNSGYDWESKMVVVEQVDVSGGGDEQLELTDLEGLGRLLDLRITIKTSHLLAAILGSDR